MNFTHLTLFFLLLLTLEVQSKCAFRINQTGWPVKLKQGQDQPHIVGQNTNCKEYIGKMGCCDLGNDKQQNGSYIEIDSIFGYNGGGCDHCAINLKRFWCEYACSPNQASFTKVSDDYVPIPDPEKPGQNITVQMIKLTVQAQTACDLYNSCKRNAFVSSVSAMGSPAGFLTFQGHNAVDQAFQYIEVDFLYDQNQSLTFSDQFVKKNSSNIQNAALTTCQTKVSGSMWHGFKFNQDCKCSTCEQACDKNSGFVYTQSSVFEGFNWMLVGGTYIVFGLIATIITVIRKRNLRKQNKNE